MVACFLALSLAFFIVLSGSLSRYACRLAVAIISLWGLTTGNLLKPPVSVFNFTRLFAFPAFVVLDMDNVWRWHIFSWCILLLEYVAPRTLGATNRDPLRNAEVFPILADAKNIMNGRLSNWKRILKRLRVMVCSQWCLVYFLAFWWPEIADDTSCVMMCVICISIQYVRTL